MQWWGDETTGFYPRGSFQTNSFMIDKNKVIWSDEQEAATKSQRVTKRSRRRRLRDKQAKQRGRLRGLELPGPAVRWP